MLFLPLRPPPRVLPPHPLKLLLHTPIHTDSRIPLTMVHPRKQKLNNLLLIRREVVDCQIRGFIHDVDVLDFEVGQEFSDFGFGYVAGQWRDFDDSLTRHYIFITINDG